MKRNFYVRYGVVNVVGKKPANLVFFVIYTIHLLFCLYPLFSIRLSIIPNKGCHLMKVQEYIGQFELLTVK